MPHAPIKIDYVPGQLVRCVDESIDTDEIIRKFAPDIRPLVFNEVYLVRELETDPKFGFGNLIVVDAQGQTFPRFAGFEGEDPNDITKPPLYSDNHAPWEFHPFVFEDAVKRFYDAD